MQREVQSFNLTFQGEIQPGYSVERVKQRFAAVLGIDDEAYLERCFSGERVVLRDNLDRKAAADLYRRLSKLGVVSELVRQSGEQVSPQPPSPPKANTASAPGQAAAGSPSAQRDGGLLARDSQHIDQKWAVSDAARLRAEREAAERAAREAQEARARREAEQQRRQREAEKAAKAEARQRAAEAAKQRAQSRRQAREAAAEARAQARAERARARDQERKAAGKKRAEQMAPRQGENTSRTNDGASRKNAAIAKAREIAARLHVEAITRRERPDAAECRTRPNPYALSPFRATADLRQRPERALQLKVRYLALATAAFLVLLVAVVARALLLPPALPQGPSAVAPLHGGGLLLVAQDRLLLHDRAGVGSGILPLKTLELSQVDQVLPVPDGEGYYVLGRAAAGEDEAPGARGLWRCQFQEPACEAFGPQSPPPVSIVTHPYYGMQLQALPEQGELRKVDASGQQVASTQRSFTPQPTLRLRDGLLYINSAEGPALSVLRYEDAALGKQLDEILLLAPDALEAGRERVGDFTSLGEQWWVILFDPESDERGLYLFDHDWGYLRPLPLPEDFNPRRLLAWGEKVLVLDPDHAALQRFNSEGELEVPLRSDLLLSMIEDREHQRWLYRLLWQGLITVLLLAFVACAGLSYLHHLRTLAFKPGWIRGAEPIAGDNTQIHWLDAPEAQYRAVQRVFRVYLVVASLLLAAAVFFQVEPHYLTALLLLLGGPALALWFYLRCRVGHLGVIDDRLLLVDHRRTYHLGQGSRILYRGWFLMIDDVLVYTGPHWFPAFASEQLQQHIVPLAQLGVRVDRRSVVARLVEARHPLALGGAIVLMTTLAALSTLLA